MPSSHSRRLSPDELQADRNALVGLQSLPDYAPFNGAYTTARIADLGRQVEEARLAEMQAVQALAAARDAAQAAEWELHEGIIGARSQVIAQYGPDSSAVRLLGLKKKSEYRTRRRRAPVPA